MPDQTAHDDQPEPAGSGVDLARGQHISGMARCALLSYLRSEGGEELVARVLEQAGGSWSLDELEDRVRWSSYAEFRALLEATAAVLGEEASLAGAGAHIYQSIVGPEYAEMLQALGSPAALIEISAEANAFLSLITDVEAEALGPREFLVELRHRPGFEPFAEYCAFYAGMTSISPRLYGFPAGEVVEETCQCHGADACRYRLTWDEVDDARRQADSLDYLTKILSARLAGLQQTVTELAASDDLDSMLELIVGSSARAVSAPAYVLALETLPADRRVYARGLDDDRAQEVAGRLLARDGVEPDAMPGVLAVDISSARRSYGRLAAVDPDRRRQYLPEESTMLAAYASIAAAALDLATAIDTARRQASVAEAMADLLADERTLLSGIVDGLPHGVAWADSSGIIAGANRAFVELLGYSRVDDVLDRRWDQVCPDPAATDHLLAWIAEVGRERKRVINRELQLGPADDRRVALVSAVPLQSQDGIRVLSIWADMTEQRAFEQRLADATRLESIGLLAAGMAHEINTPMQYIGDNGTFLDHGFTRIAPKVDELLEAAEVHGVDPATLDAITARGKLGVLRVRIPRAVSEITDGVQAVSRIVRSLKTFSHPGGDDFGPVDLTQVVESTLAVSRGELKRRAVVDVSVPADLPPIRAVPGMINQVLLNLVVNSAHAVEERFGTGPAAGRAEPAGRISISAEATDTEVEVAVADNGCGIPPAITDKVYDQFVTTKEVGKGSGQGLAICRNIVTGHGGTIDFTSSEDGTTFVVRLPRWPEDAHQ